MEHNKGLKPTPAPVRRLFGSFNPEAQATPVRELPPRISYEGIFDVVDDQGQTNTCVAHGCVATLEAFIAKHHSVHVELSRRALYWRAKKEFENANYVDDGLSVGEGLQTYQQFGYVLESDWPFDPGNLFAPVPDNLWKNDYPLAGFDAVPISSDGIRSALLHRGPVIIGSTWPSAWEEPGPDGLLPAQATPSSNGHCTALVAYDDTRAAAYDRNSWGGSWGHNGYAWLPYAALNDPNLQPWEAFTVRLP